MMIMVIGGGALICCVLIICAGVIWFYKDELFPAKAEQPAAAAGAAPAPAADAPKGRVPNRFTADTKDGKGIFACQARWKGSGNYMPGETSDGYPKCVITYGGARSDEADYKVLRPERAFNWLPKGSGPKLVKGGSDRDSKNNPLPLYVCRAKMDDGLWHIGKSLAGSKKCILFTENPEKPERVFDEPHFDYAVYK